LHRPTFGKKLPTFELDPDRLVAIPIWFPLSAFLGWIVIRELRWREKRGKEADENDSHTGGGGGRV
jgi:hypothetical protein